MLTQHMQKSITSAITDKVCFFLEGPRMTGAAENVHNSFTEYTAIPQTAICCLPLHWKADQQLTQYR